MISDQVIFPLQTTFKTLTFYAQHDRSIKWACLYSNHKQELKAKITVYMHFEVFKAF